MVSLPQGKILCLMLYVFMVLGFGAGTNFTQFLNLYAPVIISSRCTAFIFYLEDGKLAHTKVRAVDLLFSLLYCVTFQFCFRFTVDTTRLDIGTI